MKHCKTPWIVGHTSAAGTVIDPADPTDNYGKNIGIICDKANARRIVAAVNACAGISTEMLEALPSGKIARLKKERDEAIVDKMAVMMEMDRLRAENERLRDALGKIVEVCEPSNFVLLAEKIEAIAVPAIAEAETKEPALPVNNWIPVESGLPPKKGFYICWMGNEQGLIHYCENGWQSGFYNEKVTHWMMVGPPGQSEPAPATPAPGLSDSEFINAFEETIISEFSAPPFGCDFMSREDWAEMMKEKRGVTD